MIPHISVIMTYTSNSVSFFENETQQTLDDDVSFIL